MGSEESYTTSNEADDTFLFSADEIRDNAGVCTSQHEPYRFNGMVVASNNF